MSETGMPDGSDPNKSSPEAVRGATAALARICVRLIDFVLAVVLPSSWQPLLKTMVLVLFLLVMGRIVLGPDPDLTWLSEAFEPLVARFIDLVLPVIQKARELAAVTS